jgi:hypothetical protein
VHEVRTPQPEELEIATLAAKEFEQATADVIATAIQPFQALDAHLRIFAEPTCDPAAPLTVVFGKLQVTGDPSGFSRNLAYGDSVFGVLRSRYNIHVVAPPEQGVADRVRLVRDFMAGRELGQKRVGRFAYLADLDEFAQDLEEAKWPTDRDGRVTRETDLDHNTAEHTADALCYGVSYYHHRSQTYSVRPAVSHHRPLTAGLRDMQF